MYYSTFHGKWLIYLDDLKNLKIDFEELEEEKRRNFKSRLEFIKWYTDWLKKTPNSVWSKVQKEVVEQVK